MRENRLCKCINQQTWIITIHKCHGEQDVVPPTVPSPNLILIVPLRPMPASGVSVTFIRGRSPKGQRDSSSYFLKHPFSFWEKSRDKPDLNCIWKEIRVYQFIVLCLIMNALNEVFARAHFENYQGQEWSLKVNRVFVCLLYLLDF